MESSRSLERYSESVVRANRYRQEHERINEAHDESAEFFHGLTIAISREAGTPGTALAHELGQRLNWAVYDHELVDRIAHEMGLRPSQIDNIDEKQASWLMESLAGMSSRPNITESAYVRHLVETIFELGRKGSCIIVGRGAGFILPSATTLRVRLVGLLEDRVADVSHRLGIPREEAQRWVAERDHQRLRFLKSHFSSNPADPLQHDLVLNTSRWSVVECANQIMQSLHDFESHPAAKRALHTADFKTPLV